MLRVELIGGNLKAIPNGAKVMGRNFPVVTMGMERKRLLAPFYNTSELHQTSFAAIFVNVEALEPGDKFPVSDGVVRTRHG